jgi:hypothetical protein
MHAFTGTPYADTVVIVDGDPHDHCNVFNNY